LANYYGLTYSGDTQIEGRRVQVMSLVPIGVEQVKAGQYHVCAEGLPGHREDTLVWFDSATTGIKTPAICMGSNRYRIATMEECYRYDKQQ
jgi:hypothetical protein